MWDLNSYCLCKRKVKLIGVEDTRIVGLQIQNTRSKVALLTTNLQISVANYGSIESMQPIV